MEYDLTKTHQEIGKEMLKVGISELSKGYLLGASSHKMEVSNQAMGDKYLTSALYLLQSDLSGYNVCPHSTASCREICLGTCSGRSAMVPRGKKVSRVQVARLRRTLLFKKYPVLFTERLDNEIQLLVKKATKKGVQAAVRINGTSDLPVEIIFHRTLKKYPEVMFYDYTKSVSRMVKFLKGEMPTNYHLTFSYAPENHEKAIQILQMGGNVAVAFDSKKSEDFVGKTFLEREILNGDLHDLRFTDPQGGQVIGLTKKGLGKIKSTMGFFVSINDLHLAVAA